MKIPDKLKVGAIEYRVEQVSEIIDSQDLTGRIDYRNATIQIDQRGDPMAKLQTFFHEMVHAIHNHTAADRNESPPNEREVDTLASALVMVVKDNPEVFAPDDDGCTIEKRYGSDSGTFVEHRR